MRKPGTDRSRPWLRPSREGRAKRSDGGRLPRLSTPHCRQFKVALRRPVEAKQYVSIRYAERLGQAGIEPPVGSVGDIYDNALAESINGLFKAEVMHRRGPRRSLEAVEFATLEWVDWYNHRRVPASIGDMPPAEAEARYYEQLEPAALAA